MHCKDTIVDKNIDSFENRFYGFTKEEDCILAFINPFSLSEGKVIKMPSNI